MKARPAVRRSALTNRSRRFLHPQADTPEARRFSDLLSELEIERGGYDAMTTMQREAARQWAGLAIIAETMRAAMARGEKIDPEGLGQIGDRMDRQARRMGPVKAPTRQTLADRHAAARERKP